MLLQRALTKQTHSEESIRSLINNTRYSDVVVGEKSTSDPKINAKEASAIVQKSHKATMDAIDEVFNLRRAIARTNAETIVEIPKLGTMSIADAIIYRRQILPLLKVYSSELQRSQVRALKMFEANQEVYNSNIHAMTDAFSKDKMESANQPVGNLIESIIEMNAINKPTLLDNSKNLEELNALINFLEEELDSILSIANATTPVIGYTTK